MDRAGTAGVVFRDSRQAEKALQRLGPMLPEGGLSTLKLLLRQVPDPDAALQGMERFVLEACGRADPLFSATTWLRAATAAFAHSRHLTNTLLRHPELLEWALEEENLYRVASVQDLRSSLGSEPATVRDQELALTLARFKRMQILRIALRDLLGIATVAEVTEELANLADALLQGAHEHLRQKLMQRFGRPLTQADSGPIECHFVVLGLGKLGGRELNYSSDIDLMYLYTGDGETSGPISISNREFFTLLANQLTDLLSRLTLEGSCYRVDLRLRPEGSMGDVVLTVGAAAEYYDCRARDWELQMLIKARPVAGELPLGRAFLRMVEPKIYQTSTDFSTIERVAETRDRIQQKLRHSAKPGLNVKLARGGIRDIEFLVQCLQRLYGGADPWVRHGGTLLALGRLRDKGYLSIPDYAQLNAAYQYLRVLEHRLQIQENHQTHTLPRDPEQLLLLTRKMHDLIPLDSGGEGLLTQLRARMEKVTEIYERVVRAQTPSPTPEPLEAVAQPAPTEPEPPAERSWQSQLRHLERKLPGLAGRLRTLPIRWGSRHFKHLLNQLVSMPFWLAELEDSPPLLQCVADLVEHSPYLAEHLIRHPEDMARLKSVVEPASGEDGSASSGAAASSAVPETMPFDQRPEVQESLAGGTTLEEKSDWLRRFYRHEMLRILAESIHRRQAIFATLEQTSRLADFVIRAAYRLAVAHVRRTAGWDRNEPGMNVIALGRLGIMEFDLGSDADLVFVLPDEAAGERRRWTQVIERLIEITSSHTREGMIFAVDARLRPRGRDGELVQSESQFKSYFADQAEAWEAITYMKARAVAGDLDRGTRFLSELQQAGWRRHGKSGDLARLLLAMRGRLEKEQGPGHPIKAGRGGYYDIDFILMYLRLRNASMFFECLGTPERIAIIHSLGGLSGEQADRLHRNAVFFRALDHAIRVSTGHSSSTIPSARSQQHILSDLVGRWSLLKPRSHELATLTARVRLTTREVFDEVFHAGDGMPRE